MAPTGYAWWYIDAQSDDGRHALSAIAFVGSVFSPHYARAIAQGRTCPRPFGAMNIALYGARRAWAFSEMPLGLPRADTLVLGASVWRHVDDGIDVDFDESSVPWRRPMRGRLRLRGAHTKSSAQQLLRAQGRHIWWPLRPHARIEVVCTHPSLIWQGDAYCDFNRGDEPLAQGFARWDWMRTITRDETHIYFRLVERGSTDARQVALAVDAQGAVKKLRPATITALRPSRWGLRRFGFGPVRRSRLVEDTPFYARSTLDVGDGHSTTMHESLDLRRWSSPWVRFLLGFRLRRLSSSRRV